MACRSTKVRTIPSHAHVSSPHLQLLLAFLLACLLFNASCSESSFELAEASRLPKWFELPKGAKRSDVHVTLDYYSMPWGASAVLKLQDRRGQEIARVRCSLQTREPIVVTEAQQATGPLPYPQFEIATAQGITEVFEHRGREPVFYITDDDTVKRQLKIKVD